MIKFYSEESAGFVMLDNVAGQVLTMMGHGGSKEGAVDGEALSSALDKLTSAVAREQDKADSGNPEEQSGGDDWDEADDGDEPKPVSISSRATPLIEMLRRATDADSYVMWRTE